MPDRGSTGVAVIGGGMAGRAHAAAYRTASTLFGLDRPAVRLVAVADVNQALARDAARRYGYGRAAASGETGPVLKKPVENEDAAVFTGRFGSGAVGTFSVSRVAHGQPDGLGFEIFGTAGSAAFDLHRLGEFTVSTAGGLRRMIVGPEHPYILDGLPMAARGAGHGTGDLFGYQARAFLDQVSGIPGLPPCADFRTGLHGLAVLDAIAGSARAGGAAVPVAAG